MSKILRIYRNTNVKQSFEEAKAALISLRGQRVDGEQILCRYMDGDDVKTAIGVYAKGVNKDGVSVFKDSDEVNNDIKNVLEELGLLQLELDTTQRGAGLNEDGTYTAPSGDDILEYAGSLYDADEKLAEAIRNEAKKRQEAIEALDVEDTEVEGNVVVAVNETDGKVESVKKQVQKVKLTGYTSKGENDSLQISESDSIGDALGAVEEYIKNLDVAPISESGKAIVSVSETNGRISAETGNIDASTVELEDHDSIIDATNVEDALQEIKKAVDQIHVTSLDNTITITKVTKQPTDIGVNIKTGERLIKKDGNNGIYTDLKVEKKTDGLPANIREQYQIKDSDGVLIGSTIDIYKDSSLLSVALLHANGTLKPTFNKANNSWTDIAEQTEALLALCFAYEDVNNDIQIIAIPVGNFLRESEFKDGFSIKNTGEVYVLADVASGKVITEQGSVDVITVGENGVKIANIQEAINYAISLLKYQDTETTGQFVTSVNEVDGVISVTRSKLTETVLEGFVKTTDNGNITSGDTVSKALSKLENQIEKTGKESKTVVQKELECENTENLDVTSIVDATNGNNIYRIGIHGLATDIELNEESERAKQAEADALADAKEYTDGKSDALTQKLNDEIDRAKKKEEDIDKEIDNLKEKDKDLQQQITANKTVIDKLDGTDGVEGSVANALRKANAYTDEKVSELNSKDSALERMIEDEERRAKAAEEQNARDIATNAKDISDLKDKDKDLQQQITSNKSVIDKLDGTDGVEGSVANALRKANAYTDNKITELTGYVDTNFDALEAKDSALEEMIKNETSRAKAVEEQNARDIAKNAEDIANLKIVDTQLKSDIDSNRDLINILNGNEDTQGSILNIFRRSKEYTDTKVEQINGTTAELQDGLREEIARAKAAEEQNARDIATNAKDISDLKAEDVKINDSLSKKIESVEVRKNSAVDTQYTLYVDGIPCGDINIPKDQFLREARYDKANKQLVFNFVTSTNDNLEVRVDLEDLLDEYTAGNGLLLSNNEFSIRIDPSTEKYLTVSSNGLKVSGIDAELDKKANVTDAATKTDLNTLKESVTKNTTALEKLNGSETTEGSILNILKKSKDYTDEKVKSEKDERESTFNDFKTTVNNELTTIKTNVTNNTIEIAKKANASDVYDRNTCDTLFLTKTEASGTYATLTQVADFNTRITSNTAEIAYLKSQLSASETRFAGIETRLNSLEARMSGVKGEIDDTIVTSIENLNSTVGETTINSPYHVNVQVVQTKGLLKSLTVVERDIMGQAQLDAKGEEVTNSLKNWCKSTEYLATTVAEGSDTKAISQAGVYRAINSLRDAYIAADGVLDARLTSLITSLTTSSEDADNNLLTVINANNDALNTRIDNLNATESGSSTDDLVTVTVKEVGGLIKEVQVKDSIDSHITGILAGEGFNSTVDDSSAYVSVTVTQHNGKLSRVVVTDSISAYVDGRLDGVNSEAEVKGDYISYKITQENTKLKEATIDETKLKEKFTSIDGEISSIKTDITNIKSDVSTLKTNVSTLQTKVTTIEGDITTIQNDISALKTKSPYSAVTITSGTSASPGTLAAGEEKHIIYVNNSSSPVTVTVPPSYKTNVTSITIPGGGIGEVNFVNISGTIYARAAV